MNLETRTQRPPIMTTATAAPPCGSPCADALEMLTNGLEHTRALADECRRFARHVSPDRDMQQVADALCRAIRKMADLEEELFFPAARKALETSCVVDLAELEHATARQIIRQMQVTDPCEARYEALVVALVDCVERHAHLEQAELFPRLRASCMDLAALGERISLRQREQDSAH